MKTEESFEVFFSFGGQWIHDGEYCTLERAEAEKQHLKEIDRACTFRVKIEKIIITTERLKVSEELFPFPREADLEETQKEAVRK